MSDQAAAPDHEQARREKLRRIVDLGHDPWGARFDSRASIGEVRRRAGEIFYRQESGDRIELPDLDNAGQDFNFRGWLAEQGKGELDGPHVRTAGRIVRLRDSGKLLFADIRDWTGEVQLFIGQQQVGTDWDLAQCFDLGDIIGVEGVLRRTKMGELSIFADRLFFLTKSLEPPPDKHSGLVDVELRHRMRYLDLTYGPDVMERFIRRSRIVQSIRSTLGGLGYVEVEGPTLHAIAGGAAARPFTTHHNTLDLDLFLRIALELHLKRLLVGGMEKVYELGRVYRNEGISPKHNPEFTMLEVYEAYGDYRTMMELTEKCIVDAIDATGQPRRLPYGGVTLDFRSPFEQRSYHDLFGEHTGVDPADEPAVAKLAAGLGFVTTGKHADVVKNEVFEAVVEEKLIGPIFVIDYPASICPLTKRKGKNPNVAERFELFICGMEIANAYTELNDPDLQQQLFTTQLAGLSEDDSMAKMDHEFIRGCGTECRQRGGLGIGIDRLVMLLTNSQSIREVILFPLLRPERGEDSRTIGP